MTQERYPLQHLLQPYTVINRHIAFHRKWEKLLEKVENLKVDALEEYDEILTKMDQVYKGSSTRILQKYLNAENEYEPKLKELRKQLSLRIDSRFSLMKSHTLGLIRDPEKIEDVFKDKKRFEEAAETFNLLDAFSKRWKDHTSDPKNRKAEINKLREALSKKHTIILKEWNSLISIRTYQKKLEVLENLREEIDRLYSWYCTQYLNLDGKNQGWYCDPDSHVCIELPEGVSWMPVDFHDSEKKTAPLEHLKNQPTEKEIRSMEQLLSEFLKVYREQDLLTHSERYQISDFETFKDYSDRFSLFSDDAEERLKAALLEQVSTFHTLMNDAKARHDFKKNHEKLLGLSFASYFAPIDEIYSILERGTIHSDDSLTSKTSGIEKGVILRLFPKIEDGDVGFIFPVTKMLAKSHFLQLNTEDGPEIHLYNKSNPEKHVEVDVRDGVFLAPKDKKLKYTMDGQEYHETYEAYFKKFFACLARDPPDWFDPSRLEGWLSRHCIFYTDSQRKQLLRMLENKMFVSVINKFTNKEFDNLAFYQKPGTINPTGQHKIYDFPGEAGSRYKHALTLFEWKPK